MLRNFTRSAQSLAILSLLSVAGLAHATNAKPQITEAVDNARVVTLKGNTHPLATRANDRGAVSVSLPAQRILLLLKHSAAQEAELKQFLNDVHVPGSPSYHKWLTPAQFGAQFGPADSDIQAVVAWLQSQGFSVAHVSAGKTTIEFSGTAGQIQSAFHTEVHQFNMAGAMHLANISDPQIPAALAPVVAGVSPLNDFHPRPQHTAVLKRESQRQPGSNRPQVTAPNGDGTNSYYVGPYDAATIYDVPNKALNSVFSGSNLDGTGVTIAVAGDSNIDTTDVDNYRSIFSLPANTPQVIVDGNDPGINGDGIEALLDTEVAGGIAPGAAVVLYVSDNTSLQSGLFLAAQRAIDDNTANILNVSFGGCEAFQGISGNQEILNFWEQAAAQGMSVTVSTGDSGSAACDDPNTETSAQYGLAVSGLSSTPYNIAVGGTDFNLNSTNAAQYWNTTNGTGYESAKSYIPEIPWDDSTSTIGPVSGDVPFTDSTTQQTNIVGAGGGASNCLNAAFPSTGGIVCNPIGTGATAGYPKPAWQAGAGVPADGVRDVPDVALFASDGFHNATWFICTSGTDSSGAPYTDCVPDPANNNQFSFSGVGGTSAAAPAFAGMLALVNQKYGRQGQADYILYPLAAQHSSVFHDVNTGNNSVVCTAGTANCGPNGFLTGYNTSAGYDLATGLGSMDVAQLVSNWNAITFKPTTTSLQLNGSTSPITVTHGTAVNVSASVTSSGGTPTGDVAIVNNSTQAGSSVAPVNGTTPSPSILTLNSSGQATSSYPFFPGGTYHVTANYDGDGTFASSVSSPIQITVNPEASVLELFVESFDNSGNAVSVSGQTLPYGTYVTIDAQPVGQAEVKSNNPPAATGTVTFTNNGTQIGNSAVPINSNGFAELPGQTTSYYTPGNYSIGASYSGDASLNPSTATPPVAFAITKAATATAASSSISSVGTGQSAVIAVNVVPPSLGVGYSFFGDIPAYPTGTVTLTDAATGATLGTATAALTASTTQFVSTAQFTVAVGQLATGANNLTVTYAGDGNYTGSSASLTITSTGSGGGGGGGGSGSYTLAASPSTLSLANTGPTNDTGQSSITVTPTNGFTGAVAMTCAVTGGPANANLAPTCALSAASVSITSGAVKNTLTVTSIPASSALHSPFNGPLAPHERQWYAAGGAALACVFLIGIPRRRRQFLRSWQRMLCLVALLVVAGAAGCGGGSSGSSNPGTTAGSYTVTVTATSGSLAPQTASVAVSVTQ